MRFVEKAVTFPMRCAVIPYIGQNHEKGFIDTGVEIPASAKDSHVYVSVAAVEQMARMVGFVHPAFLEAEVDRLLRELKVVQDQLAEADKELAAIDVLKNRGYVPARSAGRPRKVNDADS